MDQNNVTVTNERQFTEPEFKRMVQIGIIVPDVEKCVSIYENQFGMGPWEISIIGNEVQVFKDMKVNGEKCDFKIKWRWHLSSDYSLI